MNKGALTFVLAAAAALSLFVGAIPTEGQEGLGVDIASVDDSGAPQVRAVVNVLDPTGRPLTNLTAENFLVSVNGQAAAVTDVRAAVNSDIGVAVVITVDVSGSMEGAPIQQARAGARAFVEGLAPVDSAAVLAFSDAVTTVQDFTTDRAALLAAIDGLQSAGNTALYQAASVAAGQAASSPSQRKAIILLSDGLDYGGKSAVSRDDSIAQGQQLGVPFFAVGLGSEIDRQYLTQLAEATGGRFLETPTPEGLSDLFRTIGDYLRSQYVVTVNVEGLDRAQPLGFDVEVRSGQLTGRASLQLPPREERPLSVVLTGLSAGARIENPVTVQAQVTGGSQLQSVSFLVDGGEVYTFTAPPFHLGLDPQGFAGGEHVLRVEAQDTAGRVGTAEVPFTTIVPASGGGPSPAVLLLALAVIIAGVGGFLFVLYRRRQELAVPSVETRARAWSSSINGGREDFTWSNPAPVTIEDRPLGRLIVASGPRAGEAFEVGERPRRIGSASYCDIVLSDAEGQVAEEEARVWVSEGRLMFHKLARLSAMTIEATAAGWLILDPGDELRIGPYQLIFELAAAEEPQPESLLKPEPAPQAPVTPESHAATGPQASEPANS